MNGCMQGKTAIVTGSATGLGKAMAEALAKEGANIIITDIDEKTGKETAAALKAQYGNAEFFSLNVAKKEQLVQVRDEIVAKHGKIDVLINNAGIAKPEPSLNVSEEDWKRVMDVNLNGVFYACQVMGD